MGVPLALLACASVAFGEEDVLADAQQLISKTKRGLKSVLEHNPHLASMWNTRMRVTEVHAELQELADELNDMETNTPRSADMEAAEMCFARIFKGCSIQYGPVPASMKAHGDKRTAARLEGGDTCMAGLKDCGHSYSPLICVPKGKDEYGTLQEDDQMLCPESIAAQDVTAGTTILQGCCVGAYPFEDCARNPYCKHRASPAFLESQGRYLEAAFASLILKKKFANVDKGGDLLFKPTLTEAEKASVNPDALSECPLKQVERCKSIGESAECMGSYVARDYPDVGRKYIACEWKNPNCKQAEREKTTGAGNMAPIFCFGPTINTTTSPEFNWRMGPKPVVPGPDPKQENPNIPWRPDPEDL